MLFSGRITREFRQNPQIPHPHLLLANNPAEDTPPVRIWRLNLVG
jgi:hypothetical protein